VRRGGVEDRWWLQILLFVGTPRDLLVILFCLGFFMQSFMDNVPVFGKFPHVCASVYSVSLVNIMCVVHKKSSQYTSPVASSCVLARGWRALQIVAEFSSSDRILP
jgi:hypothetical protein